jgi:glycosyltransferase involved in cell wall biosynthesis
VSGYGIAADRCMAALEGAGVEVDWEPYVPEEREGLFYGHGLSRAAAPPARGADGERPVVVVHHVPEYFPRVRSERGEAFLVGHTVWETDRLPRHWRECMEAVDLLVVPCRMNEEVIRRGGVRTPVAVVGHAAPAPLPAAAGEEEGPAGGFPEGTLVFYTIAMWTERKAVYRTVEAFLRAFTARDPVALVVKSSLRDYTRPMSERGGLARDGTTGWTLAGLLAQHPEPPPVRLIARDLSDRELAGLHARGDCYVSLCRSEGWGLGSFDAAAYGKPVVTTGFGGQLDYLGEWPYLVDYRLVRVRDRAGAGSYTPDQRWAEPDVEHGAALLRQIAGEPGAATARAAELGGEIRRRYSPAEVGGAFIEAVEVALRRGRSTAGQAVRASPGR